MTVSKMYTNTITAIGIGGFLIIADVTNNNAWIASSVIIFCMCLFDKLDKIVSRIVSEK